MLNLLRLDPTDEDWERMDALPDRLIFQTREWVEFIAQERNGEPVVAALVDAGETVGYFASVRVRQFGIPILGSPLRGWTTWYLGFNLCNGVAPREAAAALPRFAFDELNALHLELRDLNVRAEDVHDLGFEHGPSSTFEIDLRPSEDEIWTGMTSACRRCVRKAEKVGVVIEEATDLDFAEDYHAQLRHVFARQGLAPIYSVDRVRRLIERLLPTGRLLLLRAKNPEGKCIATGIFPAMNTTMYYWGGASWREDQILRPNEALMWHALRHWKARGVSFCDLGGGFVAYKTKFGANEVRRDFLWKSKYRTLSRMRGLARVSFRQRQRMRARVDRARSGS